MRLLSLLPALLLANTSAGAATEYPIAAPQLREGMEIAPNYLTGVVMENMRAMQAGADDVHLEADVHADKSERHGFAPGAWIPYLTVSYTIEKTDGSFRKIGMLLPMTAGDGPHYASNVTLAGKGEYRLTYHFEPPSKAGFLRHVDKETGVPPWWEAFDLKWDFAYPAKPRGQ